MRDFKFKVGLFSSRVKWEQMSKWGNRRAKNGLLGAMEKGEGSFKLFKVEKVKE